MSNEYDPFEYAELLAQTEELARSELYEPEKTEDAGLTRRDLLIKGGVGAAAVAGLGSLAGTAAAAPAASGKFTGTLRVLSLGVESVSYTHLTLPTTPYV